MPRRRPVTNPKLVVGYVRVSTDEQALGPSAQRSALDRWCEREGATLVAVMDDLGVSGAAPLEKRPGLLGAIAALSEHGAGVLLVAKRDRLARDPIISAMTEAAAARVGARVASAAGEGEGDDPASVLMRRMVDAFAEYERRVIRARTRAALAVKRSRGERVGEVPYGYQLGTDKGTVVEAAHEQRVVARVASLRREGLSIRAIASRLNREGVPARGRCWHPTSVARILRREAA